MTSAEVVKLVRARLEEAGIPYMVVGALASAVHGAPRTTQDADVVIAPSRRGLAAFLGAMERDFYVPKGGASRALSEEGVF